MRYRKQTWAFVVGPLHIGLLIAALILLGGSLFYILYGFASGFISNYARFPPSAQQMILYKFSLALQLFGMGFYLLLGTLLLRYLFSLKLGFFFLIIGLFLYLAIPLILGVFYLRGEIYNPPLELIIIFTRSTGEITIVIAGLLFLFGFASLLRNHFIRSDIIRGRETAARAPARTSFLSRLLKPCWDTLYCRDFLREFCPNYGRKRSCWKAGGGCLCDEAIVNHLLAQTSVRKPEAVPTLKKTSQLGQKKMDCGRCPIYAEHQRQKYGLIAPFIPIGMSALFFFGRESIHNYYIRAAESFDKIFSSLAYLPTTSGKVLSTLATPWLEITILVILALLLIGILLHLAEYMVFSLGW